MKKELAGEFLGTFVLVLIGLSSIVAAEFKGWLNELWQVAFVWGIGVSLAIYLTRKYSHSHLNPAVSLSFLLMKEINIKQFFYYLFFQFLGAFLAGACLYLIFENDILSFEAANGIARGESDSIRSAMVFGEFYPNPSFANEVTVSHFQAFLIEGFGTFILALVILLLYRLESLRNIFPIFVGLTVSCLIVLFAPYTQMGINPARDFGPRLFAFLNGWGEAALPVPHLGLFTVYILAPFIGAFLAFGVRFLLLKRKR